jgi:S-adenosylmethionine hydrolase
MSIIALMTDFGTRDYYVGAMKGVILQINPKVTLVDISHDIDSQDFFHGAFVLRQSLPFYPVGTIFVAVVDPTVGTSRRILAARYNDRTVLAPDNGLLTLLQRDADLQEIRVVENRRYFAATLSSTFHGRDIFAPVAAHLSRGVALADLGPAAKQIEMLSIAKPHFLPDGSIEGEVLLIDRFGNLITNISELDLAGVSRPARFHFEVFIGTHQIGPVRHAYADVPVGQPLALIGSSQMLELAVNSGHAARELGIGRGELIQLRRSN